MILRIHLRPPLEKARRKISDGMKQGKDWAEMGENRLVTPERDGRLRNLLKKTYLRRWIGAQDFSGQNTQTHLNNAGDMTAKRSSSMDFARMRIENATLKESMESMEHLTSSIHRLRASLSKVKESVISEGTVTTSMSEALDEIVTDAKLVKTALGSSLPLSWSADADDGSMGETIGSIPDIYGDSSSEKIDSVCAAGFEMVELVILASQILKESAAIRGS